MIYKVMFWYINKVGNDEIKVIDTSITLLTIFVMRNWKFIFSYFDARHYY
jgi:hypothetical protein